MRRAAQCGMMRCMGLSELSGGAGRVSARTGAATPDALTGPASAGAEATRPADDLRLRRAALAVVALPESRIARRQLARALGRAA